LGRWLWKISMNNYTFKSTLSAQNFAGKSIKESAEIWLDAGFSIIPACLSDGVKKPLVKFAEIRLELTPQHSLNWLKQFPNATALATTTDNGLFVLDADTPESLEAIYCLEAQYKVSPNLIVSTRNGEHHYFRISAEVNAISRGFDGKKFPRKIDIKTGKSIVILPPSTRDGEEAYSIKHSTITNIDDISYVEQSFVDAVYQHNQELPPTTKNTSSDNLDKWSGDKLEVQKAKAILGFIDPNLPYEDWMRVIFGVVSEFGQTQESINLIDEWSSNGDSYKGREEICYKVSTTKDSGGITFGTVRHFAQCAEADLVFIDQANCSHSLILTSFDLALDALKHNRDDSVAFDQAIFHISRCDTLTANRHYEVLKSVTSVPMAVIRAAVKNAKRKVPLTHSQLAKKIIDGFTGIRPVGYLGKILHYIPVSGLWESMTLEKFAVVIGKQFIDESLCMRFSEYKAIAQYVYSEIEDDGFFKTTPKGLQTPSGFHCVRDHQLVVLPKSEKNRARFKIDFDPDETREATYFISFLKSAFGESYSQQMMSLKIMLGLALIGIQNEEQKACLLYGVGGSGKSTLLKVLEALVPDEYISHVSPHDMDNEYARASLAGKLLNIVPELDKDKPIPSSDFKSITGGDTVDAREPYGRIFSVKPEAGNWFNSNFFPSTKDQSDAFFRRWVIFHFLNSTPQEQQDPHLVKRIIDEELPCVLALAFEGIKNYLMLGGNLCLSAEHKKCMAKWRNYSNTVKAWLNDDDSNVLIRDASYRSIKPIRKTFAFQSYLDWCKSNNRKPYSSSNFAELMEDLGHIAVQYQGYNTYKTLYHKPFDPPLASSINFQ
jgi:P4 family phage/plasmid primase-like protien